MKKALLVLLSVGLVALFGCSSPSTSGGDSTDDSASNNSSSSNDSNSSDSSTNQPNPIVKVDGPDAFQDQLGLYLAADQLGSNPEYSIISGQTAQVTYQTEIAGKQVDVIVRLQKTSVAEDVSGDYSIYDTVEPGQVVGETTPTLSFNDGAAGYAIWYNTTAQTSGSVAITSGASYDELNKLAEYYINQGSKGQ